MRREVETPGNKPENPYVGHAPNLEKFLEK